jgi:hypothetical protein
MLTDGLASLLPTLNSIGVGICLMQVSEKTARVLGGFRPGLRTPFEVALKDNVTDLATGHPLYYEVMALEQGNPCSFPYFGVGRVNWVTFGGNLQTLYRGIEDVRAWLIPNIAWEEAHPVVVGASGRTPLAQVIVAASPHGYFRWCSAPDEAEAVARKLRQMRELDLRRPVLGVSRMPSLFELRREFQVALATADWPAAQRAISMIDVHQLDTATNTAQMRVRLLGLTGSDREILQTVERTGLLSLRLPSKVVACILEAYARSELGRMEDRADYRAAADRYKAHIHPIVADVLSTVDVPESSEVVRLMAYRAWADGDEAALSGMALESSDPAIAFLVNDLFKGNRGAAATASANPVGVPQVLVIPESGAESWQSLVEGVRHGRVELVRGCIDEFMSLQRLLRPDQASECSQTLIEMFTDPVVTATPKGLTLANEVLLGAIDNVLCEVGFPRPSLVELYSAILQIWGQEHGESTYPPDGQLVISIAEGLLTLSKKRENEVVDALRGWWSRRPNRVRLPWLLEALDLLSMQLNDTSSIESLWMQGADLIRRDPSTLAWGEDVLWRQVGRRLGLPEESLVELLGTPAPVATSHDDPLRTANLRKIAIVTLQERAGRIAAEALKERTDAEIQLVSSLGADDATRAASECDVILFVWAASKHAVLRAFDGVREKIQYVQGTGPTSIVLAAERWVRNRTQNTGRLAQIAR